MPNPRLKPQPFPDFDRYAIDFDGSGRPWCFHLFWRDAEVANVRLEYHADGYLNRAALRAGKGKQRYISLKDLANIPFFTTYIHSIADLYNLWNLWNLHNIENIENVEKVKIESIESLPNITVLGSEGAAFEQTAPVAGAYFSPTGVEPPFVGWTDTDDAFDGLLATSAAYICPPEAWTNFLILTFAPTICNKVRIYPSSDYAMKWVDIDVYQGSTWIHAYEGIFIDNAWLEANFSQGSANKIRTRFWNSEPAHTDHMHLYEVEMWRSPTDSILETQVTNGAGAAAVNIQDGGNTITVDGAVAVTGTLTQSTKHDAKTYQFTAAGSAADGATVISNVADKVIKIHRMFLQSTVDAATNVYLYEETSGNLVTVNTTLNAREGRESAFVPAPACIGQTTTVNKRVLLKNAATKQVYWEITYSADDAS